MSSDFFGAFFMIYIHIPFCKQKCSYCNFHFSTSLKMKDEMVSAIKKEIVKRHNELENKTLKSLYFGGGTPSVLSVDELKSIMDEIQKYFSFDPEIEITLESNPDDLNQKFLKEISNTEINRLSIGTQSFFDEDLKFMNRAHSSSEAESSIKRAQDCGFENITIDLIYGSPVSGFEIWKENLQKAVNLEVPHLSSYALTVEPKTALESWISNKKAEAPSESLQDREFHYMSDFLRDKGFEHYEISNFAKKGFRSKHNSAYWKYEPYLGIGPSAHSYDGSHQRSWNIANNMKYIQLIESGQTALETEILSEKEMFNERIMIGLRTSDGADLDKIYGEFSEEILEHFKLDSAEKIANGILEIKENHLIIPEKHWFRADGIASDLFQL